MMIWLHEVMELGIPPDISTNLSADVLLLAVVLARLSKEPKITHVNKLKP